MSAGARERFVQAMRQWIKVNDDREMQRQAVEAFADQICEGRCFPDCIERHRQEEQASLLRDCGLEPR